jgi:hypothetical protein
VYCLSPGPYPGILYPGSGFGFEPNSPLLPSLSLVSVTEDGSTFPKGAFTSFPGIVPIEYGVWSLLDGFLAFVQSFCKPAPLNELYNLLIKYRNVL